MLQFHSPQEIPWLVSWQEIGWNQPSLRSVLVVEDDTFLKPLVAQILYSLDADLSLNWATSAEEAARVIEQRMPDLLIADCLLGNGQSGMGLWDECRAKWPSLPFLMMTGLARTSLEQLSPSPAGGLPNYIQKPFRVSDFRGRVKDLLLP